MKKILRNLAVISVLATDILLACPSAKEALLCEGLSQFYNGHDEAASKVFGHHIETAPDDPVGYWRKFLSDYFALREKTKTDTPTLSHEQYRVLTQLANIGIAKAEAKIGRGENVNFNRYIEASILSFLAAIQYKNESIWISLATIKKAVRIAEQSSCPEAGFLLGSINYETSKHSFIVRMMVGLPHDRNEGRAMILAAVQHNNSPFVDDIWFMIFSIEKEDHGQYARTEAEKVWRDLHGRYPDNRMLNEFKARFK